MTNELRPKFAEATRAFLHKDYAKCLLDTENGIEQCKARSDLDVWLEQFFVLRFTVIHTIYTNPSVRARAKDKLKNVPQIRYLLDLPATQLYTRLWYECVFQMSHKPLPDPCPTALEPSDELNPMVLRLSAPVLSSAILMALRIDAYVDAQQNAPATPSPCARQTCDWFFAALLHTDSSFHDMATYERILRLYVLQVLGSHSGEWNYAHDFVEYSALPSSAKSELAKELVLTRAEVESRAQKEKDIIEGAKKMYNLEMARRGIPTLKPGSQAGAKMTTAQQQDDSPNTSNDAARGSKSLERKPSIHGRTVSRHSSKTSDASKDKSAAANDSENMSLSNAQISYAQRRNDVQAFLERRPMDEPPSPPSSLTSIRTLFHILCSKISRQGIMWSIVCIVAVVLASFRFIQHRRGRNSLTGPWSHTLRHRLWDTVRMYV